MEHRNNPLAAASAVRCKMSAMCFACLMCFTCLTARAQFVNFEVEPNSTKPQATVANSGGGGLHATPPPQPTDTIRGMSLGSDSGAGITSADYFLVSTELLPKGLYCYSLEGAATTGHVVSIRGLQQINGMIIPQTDVLVQQSVSAKPNNIWYGTGGGEAFYLSVTGSLATSAAYELKFRCTPYSATVVTPDSLPAGEVNIRAFASNSADMDLWVYDSELNAIPEYGHDDPDIEGLTRVFAPGRYYIAVADDNLCNDQASPSDDDNRNAPVMDFAHSIVSSSPVFPIDAVGVVVSGGGQIFVARAIKLHIFQTFFFQFDVAGSLCPTCAADYNLDGGVSGEDIGAFFFDWESGAACADVNLDGGIDGADVLAFFTVWERGGC